MMQVAWCSEYRLWYDRPAMTWTQALPIGDGVVGGMVYGTPAIEHIQLNEETIWAGQPNNVVNPNAKEALPKVRQLIFDGKYKEAQQLANDKVMPNAVGQNKGMPYQPFGDLYIDIAITIPTKLSEKQKKILNEFAETKSVKKGWF